MPEDAHTFGNNPAWFAGDQARQLFGIGKPMGSWTGVDPLLGAPLSGALWGAGLGAVAGGLRQLGGATNPPRRKGFWRSDLGRHILLGAAGGGVLGAASGLNQKFANSRREVEKIVRQDPYISYAEKERIIRALTGADFMQLQRLAAMAAAGALTAATASRVLGLGLAGSAVAGGVGALLARNYFGGPQIFV